MDRHGADAVLRPFDAQGAGEVLEAGAGGCGVGVASGRGSAGRSGPACGGRLWAWIASQAWSRASRVSVAVAGVPRAVEEDVSVPVVAPQRAERADAVIVRSAMVPVAVNPTSSRYRRLGSGGEFAMALHLNHRMGGKCAKDRVDRADRAARDPQGGVVAARSCSLAASTRARSRGGWRPGGCACIHQGVYAVGHDAIPVRGRLVAALLVAGPGSALSHRTAAHVLALLPSMPQFIEVTTTTRPPRGRPHLRFHRTDPPRDHPQARPPPPPPHSARSSDLAAANDPDLERATSEAIVLEARHRARPAATSTAPAPSACATSSSARPAAACERAFLKSLHRHGLPEPIVAHRIGRWTVDFFWPSHALVLETDGAPLPRPPARPPPRPAQGRRATGPRLHGRPRARGGDRGRAGRRARPPQPSSVAYSVLIRPKISFATACCWSRVASSTRGQRITSP